MRFRLKNMTVPIGFREGPYSLIFSFLIRPVIRTVLSYRLIDDRVLFLERFLSNCINLFKFLFLYVVFFIAFYNVVYVRDGVFDDSGHDIDRAQMVDL